MICLFSLPLLPQVYRAIAFLLMLFTQQNINDSRYVMTEHGGDSGEQRALACGRETFDLQITREMRTKQKGLLYRDEIYSLQILFKAGPRQGQALETVKQGQEETSTNHVQRINLTSLARSLGCHVI